MRKVRLFQSAHGDVRYVFGHPIEIPFRRKFKTDAEHKEQLDALNAAKERAEADEAARWAAKTGRAV